MVAITKKIASPPVTHDDGHMPTPVVAKAPAPAPTKPVDTFTTKRAATSSSRPRVDSFTNGNAREDRNNPTVTAKVNAIVAQETKPKPKPKATSSGGFFSKAANWVGGKVVGGYQASAAVGNGIQKGANAVGNAIGSSLETQAKVTDFAIGQGQKWVNTQIDQAPLPGVAKSVLKAGTGLAAYDAHVINNVNAYGAKTVVQGATGAVGLGAKLAIDSQNPIAAAQDTRAVSQFVGTGIQNENKVIRAVVTTATKDPVGFAKAVGGAAKNDVSTLANTVVHHPETVGKVTGIVAGTVALAAVPIPGLGEAGAGAEGLGLARAGVQAAAEGGGREVVASAAAGVEKSVAANATTTTKLTDKLVESLDGHSWKTKNGTRATIRAQALPGKNGVTWEVRDPKGELLAHGKKQVVDGQLSGDRGEAIVHKQGQGIATEVYRRYADAVPTGTRLSIDSTNPETNAALREVVQRARAEAQHQGLSGDAQQQYVDAAMAREAPSTKWGRVMQRAGWELKSVTTDNVGFVLDFFKP